MQSESGMRWSDDPFLGGSLLHSDFQCSPFNSGLKFHRLFPTSTFDRYKETPLGRLSADDRETAAVIRNIPIRLESENESCKKDKAALQCQSSFTKELRREKSAPPDVLIACDRSHSNGPSLGITSRSPTLHYNWQITTKEIGLPASTNSTSGTDTFLNGNMPIKRCATKIPIEVSKSTSSLRPGIIPKQKLFGIFQNLFDRNRSRCSSEVTIDEKKHTVKKIYDSQKKAGANRSSNNGEIETSGDPGTSSTCLPSIRRPSPQSNAANDCTKKSNPSSDSDLVDYSPCNNLTNVGHSVDNTFPEYGDTTSLYSSSIDANMNHSIAETIQQTSTTSTISANSLNEQSEINEPGYDALRERSEIHLLDECDIKKLVECNDRYRGTRQNVPILLSDSLYHGAKRNNLYILGHELCEQNSRKCFDNSLLHHDHGEQLNKNRHIVAERSTQSTNSKSNMRSLSNGDIYCDNDASRKRIICEHLSENYRIIEINVKKLRACTVAGAWRLPHILQQNLPDIKDAVYAIFVAANCFLDVIFRISIDAKNPKAEDIRQLLIPLRNSQILINELKRNLDSMGWSLAVLSRPKSTRLSDSHDALDQFAAVVKQLPADCHKVIQWTLILSPSSTVHFLSMNSKSKALGSTGPSTELCHLKSNNTPSSAPYDANEYWRYSTLSQASTSTNVTLSSGDTLPSHAPKTLPINPLSDSGQSTLSSSAENVRTNVDGSYHPSTDLAGNFERTRRTGTVECSVMEEDDLESVMSDRDSFCQDYAATNGNNIINSKHRSTTNVPPTRQLDTNLINQISEDDRQLIRFYSPQIDNHTDFLSKAIDDFLFVVEEQQPPREFIQKGKLVILAAHKLIYIGDSVAQCISLLPLSCEVKRASDRLCCLLKNCVQATKQAADEYPSVFAVQSMVDSVVTVSHTAHDLKLILRQCC